MSNRSRRVIRRAVLRRHLAMGTPLALLLLQQEQARKDRAAELVERDERLASLRATSEQWVDRRATPR